MQQSSTTTALFSACPPLSLGSTRRRHSVVGRTESTLRLASL